MAYKQDQSVREVIGSNLDLDITKHVREGMLRTENIQMRRGAQ
jgi:hypothetical protein